MPDTLAAVTDLVLPRRCLGCGRPGLPLCSYCRPTEVVHLAVGGLAVVAAGEYAGVLRAALIAYKERGRRDLARPLGALLAGTLAPGAVLVPVPCAARAARARGGDHVLRLARVVARRNAVRVVTPLRLTRTVQDSAGLRSPERAINLQGAMTALPPPRPGTAVVLVDDIVTTGATLGEAARALGAAGWSVREAAVVAATARRGGTLARAQRAV